MAQMCRVYENARVVGDTNVARCQTNDELVDTIAGQLADEAVREITENVFPPI